MEKIKLDENEATLFNAFLKYKHENNIGFMEELEILHAFTHAWDACLKYQTKGEKQMEKKYTKEEAKLIEKFIDDYYNPPGGYYIKAFLKENTEPVLKPCPFCGSKAGYWRSKESGLIGCSNVRCHVPYAFSVEEWNTRV